VFVFIDWFSNELRVIPLYSYEYVRVFPGYLYMQAYTGTRDLCIYSYKGIFEGFFSISLFEFREIVLEPLGIAVTFG